MLEPYIGSRTSEHFGASPGANVRQTYGIDQTGKVEYSFNSLGFRCGEFNADANHRIYFCGCSATLCMGLDVTKSWPTLFSEFYKKFHAISDNDLSYMNFSQGGSSNRYISRTLLSQSMLAKPNLIVVQFSYVGRTEFLIPVTSRMPCKSDPPQASVVSVGPWFNKSWATHQLFLFKTSRKWRSLSRQILSWTRWYYRNYSIERAVYNTLIDIALLQQFCKANEINLIITCLDHDKIAEHGINGNKATISLYRLIKPALLHFSIIDPHIDVDKAVDGFHPGTQSNQLFAERLWDAYLCLKTSNDVSKNSFQVGV